MAKSQSSESFSISVVDEDRARAVIDKHSRRGGRGTKYNPLLEAAVSLENGKSILVNMQKNEVAYFRMLLKRKHGEGFDVTARSDSESKDTDARIVSIRRISQKPEEEVESE